VKLLIYLHLVQRLTMRGAAHHLLNTFSLGYVLLAHLRLHVFTIIIVNFDIYLTVFYRGFFFFSARLLTCPHFKIDPSSVEVKRNFILRFGTSFLRWM